MADAPWMTIIGLGEDGLDGLSLASRSALEAAEVIMGPARHLGLVPDTGAERIEWPVPFAGGIERLETLRGRRVAVLASGDPFWFGAGAVIARHFQPAEWVAHPGRSTFSLGAARLGWSLERTVCLGLHSAPLSRLRPHLAPGTRALVLLRDGDAVAALAAELVAHGFADSRVTVMEALGGPKERITHHVAGRLEGRFAHPVCAAIDVADGGMALTCASGQPDTVFRTDGVMTKRPVRALTLSALAPRPGERLWDIGGGSGTVAIEWLLAHPANTALTIEPRADRVAMIRENADALGADRLEIVEGRAPEAFAGLAQPDAVFVGGGLSVALLDVLETALPPGTRMVANAVTLENDALLGQWHVRKGGELMRIEIAHSAPLGEKRGWKSAYPVTQWRGEL